MSPSKEVLEKAVDDPLQKGKETTSEAAGKTSLPLLPKQTREPATQNAKQKEMIRDDEDGEDYVFKFINDYICKPMGNGFEVVFQWQSNLQEMQLRH